jgi:hypothetical protein
VTIGRFVERVPATSRARGCSLSYSRSIERARAIGSPDGLGQGIIGAVRERVAVDYEKRPPRGAGVSWSAATLSALCGARALASLFRRSPHPERFPLTCVPCSAAGLERELSLGDDGGGRVIGYTDNSGGLKTLGRNIAAKKPRPGIRRP